MKNGLSLAKECCSCKGKDGDDQDDATVSFWKKDHYGKKGSATCADKVGKIDPIHFGRSVADC